MFICIGAIYLIGVTYFYLINNFYLEIDILVKLAVYSGFLITLPEDIITSLITSLVGVKIASNINFKSSSLT